MVSLGGISAAGIAKGCAGYICEFVNLPSGIVIRAVVLVMGAIAAWRILQSVAIAGLMTLIEVGGLLIIIYFGATRSPDHVARIPEIWSRIGNLAAVTGVLSASMLAFVAFSGFDATHDR